MFTYEQAESSIQHFVQLSPAQRGALINEAADLRDLAIAGEPFAYESFELWRLRSQEKCRNWVEDFYPDVKEGDKEGAAASIEIEILKLMQEPAFLAWEHAYRYLNAALRDDKIQANPVVVLMLEAASWNMTRASPWTDSDDLYDWVKGAARKEGVSWRASKAASLKNAEPRAWVLSEWQNLPDKTSGKAAFAREYAAKVKTKYRLSVLPETISRDWLPKTKG